METPFWIEKAWGDQVENATMDDVRVAIQETLNMDDEHAAFWVGHYENENALEVHKDLEIFYVSGDNQTTSKRNLTLGKKQSFIPAVLGQ
ncbi:MAG: hypothetical protein IPP30_06380 [Flavobacterium sp.]|nr:hypothetical protein [Flavobacterium sp.]